MSRACDLQKAYVFSAEIVCSSVMFMKELITKVIPDMIARMPTKIHIEARESSPDVKSSANVASVRTAVLNMAMVTLT